MTSHLTGRIRAAVSIIVLILLGSSAALAASGPEAQQVGGWVMAVGKRLGALYAQIYAILETTPALPTSMAATFNAILTAADQGPSPVSTLASAGAVMALLFFPWLFVKSVWRNRNGARPRFDGALVAAAQDGIDILLALLIASIAAATMFKSQAPVDQLAIGLLWGTLRWRITMAALGLVLRPLRPDLRLIPISSGLALELTIFAGAILAIGIGFISVIPVLLNTGFPLP